MKKYRCILILAFAFLVVCPACALSGSNRQTSSIATVVAETQIAQIVEATEQARQSLPITATGTSVPALLPTSLPTQPAEPTETHPIVPEPQVTLIPPENPYAPAFASYPVTKVTLPAAYQGGYTLPVNLAKVKGLDLVTLSPSQTQYLSANGFVVNPPEAGKYREFYQVYEAQRYAVEQPIFITTDAVLHIYHLLFDKLLRDLEREQFDDSVKSLTSAMVKATQAQYQAVKNTALAEPARRNLAFFGVAAQLLGMPDAIPAAAQDLVAAELSLINAHSGADISPIWDRDDLPDDKKLIEDYSQYIPRGHYTRDETLQRYFRAMMWYGRLTFRAQDAFETRRALLLVQALRDNQTADGQTAANVWKDLFEPITFIVGKADDLTYYEYSALMDQAFGLQATPQALLDDAKLAAFVAGVRQLPAPQVNSMWVWIWQDKKEVTQGYRFMGQRFTLDAYVFGQLIWRNVGTEQDPRYLPKGLDFMAALDRKSVV